MSATNLFQERYTNTVFSSKWFDKLPQECVFTHVQREDVLQLRPSRCKWTQTQCRFVFSYQNSDHKNKKPTYLHFLMVRVIAWSILTPLICWAFLWVAVFCLNATRTDLWRVRVLLSRAQPFGPPLSANKIVNSLLIVEVHSAALAGQFTGIPR